MILSIADRVVGAFVLPRLAQAPNSQSYMKMNWLCHAVFFGALLMILFTAWAFPRPWLLLLGDKYFGLKDILWLSFLGPILMNVSGFTFSTLSSRGYTANQLPILMTGILVQFITIYWLGMKDARSVFIIGAITAAVFAFGQFILLVIKTREIHLIGASVDPV